MRLKKLEQVAADGATIEKAVRAGAAIVADKIRANLDALPEEEFRKLGEGEMFRGLPAAQKRDLQDSFGLTPIEKDRNGFIHTKAGFNEYGSYPTKAYPDGVPNQLLARAVESGSSVRQKTPFVEPAIRATRAKAIEAMEKVIDEEIKKIL